MTFTETSILGAMIVEMEKRSDERGFFARAFCAREMAAIGLNPDAVQINVEHGAVRLSGQVETATDAALLERFVARVPGVGSVTAEVGWRFDDRAGHAERSSALDERAP